MKEGTPMSAQLFFIYGTMNSGKSTQLLSTAHTYKEQGKQTLLLSSALDTRSHEGELPHVSAYQKRLL